MPRYVDEFAFRWNTRSALGIEDTGRASRMIKGASGKRLTYRTPDNAVQALTALKSALQTIQNVVC